MKLRVGKKLQAYNFEKYKWEDVRIVHIDLQESLVTVKDNKGSQWYSDLSEFDDKDCFREK